MTNLVKYFFLSVVAFNLIASQSLADERRLPAATLYKLGYRPFNSFPHYRGSVRVRADLPGNIPWPVQFVDAARNIAQNYINFQDYGGGSYYHKGCDLRSPANSAVKAPVTGVLEGGYYSYTDNPDGSETKQWIPWNGKVHSDPYFELAVVTNDGYRFELHHVDSIHLPQETIQMLNKGNVIVEAGKVIGTVLPWGDGDYHHIHYNIYRQDGVLVNPEAHSVAPPDHVAPKILGVFGVLANGKIIEMVQGGTFPTLSQIVVATTETRDNSIYVQTPPYIGIQFQTREMFAWDFRQVILGPDNKWPDIRQVFVSQLRTPSGKILSTVGQYGKGLFLMRLPVPAAHGPFTIAVADTAGNVTKFTGVMQ